MSFFTSLPKAFSLFNGWSQSSFYTEWMDLISLLLDIGHLGISHPHSKPNIERVLMAACVIASRRTFAWRPREENTWAATGTDGRTGCWEGSSGTAGSSTAGHPAPGCAPGTVEHWHCSEIQITLTPALLCQGLCHAITAHRKAQFCILLALRCVVMA